MKSGFSLCFSPHSFVWSISVRFHHRLNLSQAAAGAGAPTLHLRRRPLSPPLSKCTPNHIAPSSQGALGDVAAGATTRPPRGPTFVSEGGQSTFHVPPSVDALGGSTGQLPRSATTGPPEHGRWSHQVRFQGSSQSVIAWRCAPLRFLRAPLLLMCTLLAPSFNTRPGPSQLTGQTS